MKIHDFIKKYFWVKHLLGNFLIGKKEIGKHNLLGKKKFGEKNFWVKKIG